MTKMMTTMTPLIKPGGCLISAARCPLITLSMVIMPPMPWTEARQHELNLRAKQMNELNHKKKEGGVTIGVDKCAVSSARSTCPRGLYTAHAPKL